jgi:HlyD family secretion protein
VVFVVEQGKAKLAAVRIGRMNDQMAEVLEGVGKGQSVILHPSEKITDGARVTQR